MQRDKIKKQREAAMARQQKYKEEQEEAQRKKQEEEEREMELMMMQFDAPSSPSGDQKDVSSANNDQTMHSASASAHENNQHKSDLISEDAAGDADNEKRERTSVSLDHTDTVTLANDVTAMASADNTLVDQESNLSHEATTMEHINLADDVAAMEVEQTGVDIPPSAVIMMDQETEQYLHFEFQTEMETVNEASTSRSNNAEGSMDVQRAASGMTEPSMFVETEIFEAPQKPESGVINAEDTEAKEDLQRDGLSMMMEVKVGHSQNQTEIIGEEMGDFGKEAEAMHE